MTVSITDYELTLEGADGAVRCHIRSFTVLARVLREIAALRLPCAPHSSVLEDEGRIATTITHLYAFHRLDP